MTRTRITSISWVLILLIGVLPASAQSLTLKLTDITGSSQVEPGAIDIFSFGWAVTNPTTLTTDGPEAGKPNPTEFAINLMSLDVLPQILQKLFTGDHVDEARFSVWDASQKKTYSLVFRDVIFNTLALSGHAGNPQIHSLTFSFKDIKLSIAGGGPNSETFFDFTTYKIK